MPTGIGGGVGVASSSSDVNGLLSTSTSNNKLNLLQQSLNSFPIDQSQLPPSTEPIFYLPTDQSLQPPQLQQQPVQFVPTPMITSNGNEQHLRQLSPLQVVEAYNGLGLASYLSSTPNFTPPDSIAPSPSTAYQGELRLNGSIGAGADFSSSTNGTAPLSWSSLGNTGAPLIAEGVPVIGIPRSLSMDIDLNFSTPPPVAVLPSTASPIPTGTTPSTSGSSRLAYPHYPPPTPLPHSNVQRHHPYAHPSRPPPLTHSSTSAVATLPMYFNNSAPNTPSISTSNPITSNSEPTSQNQSTNSPSTPATLQSPLVLSFPPIPPPLSSSNLGILSAPLPHRVNSAPVHSLLGSSTNSSLNLSDPNILNGGLVNNSDMEGILSNPGVTGEYVNYLGVGGSVVGIESIATSNGGVPTEWLNTNSSSVSLPIQINAMEVSNGVAGGGPAWESNPDLNLKLDVPPPPPPPKQQEILPLPLNNSTASYFDTPTYAYSPQQPQPSSSTSTPSSLLPPISQLDSAIPAIALVRNRLPILEAALSATASDPGNDEEEIWKGVEGAYEELKRVMMSRKETRRGVASLQSSKRSFSNMEHESTSSPTTPIDRDRALSASTFLSSQLHPPLLHSQSTPDVPSSTSASVARAQAQVQASQVQLQQAQLQAHQAQQDLQAEAQQLQVEQQQQQQQAQLQLLQQQEQIRVRVESELRVRAAAEEEIRVQQELEEAGRLEQYQRSQHAIQLQQQQQQEQIRMAQQQVQQQQLAQAQADAHLQQLQQQQQQQQQQAAQLQAISEEAAQQQQLHLMQQQRQQEVQAIAHLQAQQLQQQQLQQQQIQQQLQAQQYPAPPSSSNAQFPLPLQQYGVPPLPTSLTLAAAQAQHAAHNASPVQQISSVPLGLQASPRTISVERRSSLSTPHSPLGPIPLSSGVYVDPSLLVGGGGGGGEMSMGAVMQMQMHMDGFGLDQNSGIDNNDGQGLILGGVLDPRQLSQSQQQQIPLTQSIDPAGLQHIKLETWTHPPPSSYIVGSTEELDTKPSSSLNSSTRSVAPLVSTGVTTANNSPLNLSLLQQQSQQQVSQHRATRSRAASGSGYIPSPSGPRSRAASGSGFQTLMESRSRANSTSVGVSGSVNVNGSSHVPSVGTGYAMYERDEDDDDDNHDDDMGGVQTKSNPTGSTSNVDQNLREKIDPIFFNYLAEVCSDLDATDSKGEPIHQTLMAKKMERLDQSNDFRPFKFRIQAFTGAFNEALLESGFTEEELPFRKIRQYLWAQPCISRFNDDGKKAKSKGNHIWTIEAKKVPDKKWIFKEFVRCIKGQPPSHAFAGTTWTWAPRVWDAQCSTASIRATFSSPTLPSWLAWSDNILSGEAPESAIGSTVEIKAIATYSVGEHASQLAVKARVVIVAVGDYSNENDDQTMEDLRPISSPVQAISPVLPASTPFLVTSGSLPPFDGHNLPNLLPSLMSPVKNSSDLAMQDVNELARQQYLSQALYQAAQPIAGGAEGNQIPTMINLADIHQNTESQAQLHQRYSALSASTFPPLATGSSLSSAPSDFSFAPPPELIASAIQRASEGRDPLYSNSTTYSG